MKRLVLPPRGVEFPDDVNRMVRVCAERGYLLDQRTAEEFWSSYSESQYAAGWLYMTGHSDDELFRILKKYLVEVNDEGYVSDCGISHLCDTCIREFATCKATRIIWSVDKDKILSGSMADKVLNCDAYRARKREAKNGKFKKS